MPKILFHFGELALKGGNRSRFEKVMRQNLTQVLRPLLKGEGVRREHGRMIAEVDRAPADLLEYLALIPGVRNFSLVRESELSLAAMQQAAFDAVLADYGENLRGRTFRVSARRSNKQFPLNSQALNYEIGAYLKTRLGLHVNLDQPDINVHVEVGHDRAYIYTGKIAGIGGLPVGTSGKGVVLFSGGIDSPVAAYLMMKRGMRVILVHCFNSTLNRDCAKIEELCRRLCRFQGRLDLYLVDLEEFQRHAVASVPAEYRMIIYKRQMIREAERIAREVHAQALITGDSLGQVASQTVANIRAIYAVSDLPLLPPLIGMDKEEIIHLARRIGTYDTSITEYCDICAFLIARHPETRASSGVVARLEDGLPITNLKSPTRKIGFKDDTVAGMGDRSSVVFPAH